MTSSVYNYMNNAKVILPMTAACHDAANLRTLDKSGNGLHFRFGDGSTSGTYPTKLTARGYSFNGSSQYLEALANQANAITEGTWAVFYRPTVTSAAYHIYSHSDNASVVRAILYNSGTTIAFFCGDLANVSSITFNLPLNQATLVVGRRTTDGYRRLYVNGINATPNNTGVTLPGSPSIVPRLARAANSTNYCPCQMLWYGHWEYALSELQIRDLEMRLRRQLNDV